jgi:hypothetical protein
MPTTTMNMNELLDQLKTSKDNMADFVIHNLNDKTSHVLQILERCDRYIKRIEAIYDERPNTSI